jgi:hypothetical protein
MTAEKMLLLRSLGMAQIPEIESEMHDLKHRKEVYPGLS